ncbi:MAG TPA: ATP-dependent 6-phosphofructokinase [bacterium]|nr:ATP-dependent 6-phosphofructokinase [bacterium]
MNTLIPMLGQPAVQTPLLKLLPEKFQKTVFIADDERVLFDIRAANVRRMIAEGKEIPSFEQAGPRRSIFFEPSQTSAAIVTCGGLCPGINNVIRSVVMTLTYRYGVKRILGVRNGYQGFIPEYACEPIALTPDMVDHVHRQGGTMLGTSRGKQDPERIVDFLLNNKIDLLFIIGGDGTQRGALVISEAARKRGAKVSIIGIPKTVDNDIAFIDRSFGFATASSVACQVIATAHTEAKSSPNGIGLVKLMGRHSGFITCLAALAVSEANFVLIPEVPFSLNGGSGFLNALKERMLRRGHAVVLVAEGAGQDLIPAKSQEHDASGNIKFQDIGIFLKDRINEFFKKEKIEINLKYIDPSYIIRAIPANQIDSVYCYMLGEYAVHAAMSGRTEMVVGLVNNAFVHIPMAMIAAGRKRVEPHGPLWLSVIEATGQPPEML